MPIRKQVEAVLDWIFPKLHLRVSPGLRARLTMSPLCLIDVGGSMGPDARWEALRPDLIRVMSFEPDARSFCDLRGGAHDVVVTIGLSSSAGRQTLYLTQGPFASSLYPPNEAVLRDFAVMPWYEAAGEAKVEVDTLSAVLSRHPGWRPDFIKVDVEGAELDVLKGAGGAIDTALGVQVEVSIADRNTGAPLQPELDAWLRDKRLIPFQLMREHWVRKNGVYGATSRPQLAWADAVYLRGRDEVLERLRAAGGADAAAEKLAHMLAILLAYEVHDYAAELVETARRKGLIDVAVADDFAKAVDDSVVGLWSYTIRGALALTLALLGSIPLTLMGRKGRAVAGALVRNQAAPLFGALARASSRRGLEKSCVTDV